MHPVPAAAFVGLILLATRDCPETATRQASKGGTESSVKISKADLVPRESNLLGEYGSFAQLDSWLLKQISGGT